MTMLQTLIIITALSGATIVQPAVAETAQVTGDAQKNDRAADKTDLKQSLDSIKFYSVEKRDVAVKKAKAILDNFDARMEKLEKEIAEKRAVWGKEVTEKKQKALEKLKEERKEVGQRYENLKNSSKKTWEKTRDAFVKSYKKLEDKFKKESYQIAN